MLGLERVAHVVERRRLDDDAEGADEAGGREHPQEHPVKNHRHELPVLLHLHHQTTHRALNTRGPSSG